MTKDKEYEIAVEKGTKLLQLMVADDRIAGQLLDPPQKSVQGVFNSVRDLTAHGYTGQRSTSCMENTHEVIVRLAKAFQALGLDPDMACDGGENYMVEHKHSQNRTINATEPIVSHRAHSVSIFRLTK